MTIKEYILSKADNYAYEIVYQFANYCPKCRKYILSIDDEYSTGISSARDFARDVKSNSEYSHYRGYNFVYDDFNIDDSTEVELSIGDRGQEIITITVNGLEEVCSDCE